MISACMTVSVRELRTAVREWACCVGIMVSEKKSLKVFFPITSLWKLLIPGAGAGAGPVWTQGTWLAGFI